MDENQNMNNNVIDPNNPYNTPQDPNYNMNPNMYQDPNQMGVDPNMMPGIYQDPNQMAGDPNMMNQGMYQDPNQMGVDSNMMPGIYQDPNQMAGDPNMMNQSMYQDPNQMAGDPNMMNQGMYQDPNNMSYDPNMQGVYQDPNQMGFDPNMMPGMYQDPSQMGFDPNMMGPNPNSLNQNMQLDPSDPNSIINAPVPPAEGPVQTDANFNTDESNFSAPKPKSNKKMILIIGIVLALIVLVLIVLIATGVINIGGSSQQKPPEENVVVTPVTNQTPYTPTPSNEKLNFCDDYYFTYDANTWTFDQTTSAAGGNQIIQLKDASNHTLKYEINSKPIASLFASYGYDVSTTAGQEVLYNGCIELAQNNCVGQLGTLAAVTDGGFKITNSSQKMYYAYADLPASASTTAGELAQNNNQASSVVTRYYFIYLGAETDDVVFFFSLSNLDTINDAELHQNVLKMLSSIAKNASSVNTNTVGNVSVNDLINNTTTTENVIVENQVATNNTNQNGQQAVNTVQTQTQAQQQTANPNQQQVTQ